MSEQRPTPETDAEAFTPEESVVAADFARTLERERDEALSKLAKLGRMIEIAGNANDAKTEAEVALSATFAEAMALTDRDMIAAELEEARKEVQYFREGHAEICRGVKDALGFENWPKHSGKFSGFVCGLVGAVVTERDQLRKVADELAHHLSARWSGNGFEPTQAAGALRRYNDLPHVQAGKKKPT